MTPPHSALRPELVQRLRHALGTSLAVPFTVTAGPTTPAGAERVKRLVKPLVQRVIGWYVEPALRANVDQMKAIVDEGNEPERQRSLIVDIELLKGEAASLAARVDALESQILGREHGQR